MKTAELIGKIEQIFSAGVIGASSDGSFPCIHIRVEDLRGVLNFCYYDQVTKFDYLECLTALDSGDEFAVIYHLYSTTIGHRINIKTSIPRHKPVLASAVNFWRAANVYEREAAEMFGIVFENHPCPEPLLLPEKWQGHPLRKDYVYPEEYEGIEHRRAPLRKEHARP